MNALVETLIKTLKNFIARDIIYIIGGASVLLAVGYFRTGDYQGDSTTRFSPFTWVYMTGMSYLIGWGLQELACVSRITTTSLSYEPKANKCFIGKYCWLIRRLYRLYMHEEWKPMTSNQYQDSVIINEKASDDNKAELERFFYFMQIGTTIGPCAIVSGNFIFFNCKWFGLIIFLFGLFLTLLSKVKVLQIKKYERELVDFLRNGDTQAVNE